VMFLHERDVFSWACKLFFVFFVPAVSLSWRLWSFGVLHFEDDRRDFKLKTEGYSRDNTEDKLRSLGGKL